MKTVVDPFVAERTGSHFTGFVRRTRMLGDYLALNSNGSSASHDKGKKEIMGL